MTLAEARKHGLVEQLKKRCNELNLSVRGANCLGNINDGRIPIVFVWDLVEKSEAELLKRKNMGSRTFSEIKNNLADRGLQLDMRLTDALKTEIGAPLKGDEPHEDVESMSGTAAPPDVSPMLKELQQKLEFANAAIKGAQRKISEAQAELTEHEDRKRALEFTIKHYSTIALAWLS